MRLDEIKRDVLTKSTRARQPRLVASLRRKLVALTLFVFLFGLSTSSDNSDGDSKSDDGDSSSGDHSDSDGGECESDDEESSDD